MIINHVRVSHRVRPGIRRKDGYARKFARGLVKAGIFLLGKSREIVPIDTGALYESSRVVEKGAGFDKQVSVEYRMPYGLYVHEDLQAKHKPGKTAKFLERPTRIYKKQMREIVVAEMEKGS